MAKQYLLNSRTLNAHTVNAAGVIQGQAILNAISLTVAKLQDTPLYVHSVHPNICGDNQEENMSTKCIGRGSHMSVRSVI